MDGQHTNLRRNSSFQIPTSLLAYQWSNRREETDTFQQYSDLVTSPSAYNSGNVPELERRSTISQPWQSHINEPRPIHYQASPIILETFEAQNPYRYNTGAGRYDIYSGHSQGDQQADLYTLYSQPSGATSRVELFDDEPLFRNIRAPSPPESVFGLNWQQGGDIPLQNQGNQPKRQSTIDFAQATLNGAANTISRARRTSTWRARREELRDLQGYAKIRGAGLERHTFVQILFQIAFYLILLSIIYFVFIGLPLWKGTTHYMYWLMSKVLTLKYGYTIFIGVAAIYAFLPLLMFFEKYPDEAFPQDDPRVMQTALIIPCYKSASLIENTIKTALKVFPARNIFVIANGNSPEPLDNTAEVIALYGVNHVWCPVGSKIVAQFVGCYAAEEFKYVLLIDDDCALPPNFPVHSDRIKDKVKCLGYTIKSVGPDSSKGTLCQQAQDLEYKLSGLQRAMAGKMGSCTFAHGAIALWDREFLLETFHEHPGFSVSEDWFFGHVARKLGSRITMCTSIFVETETPSAIFFSSGGSRGGFGEMTIWKQRFFRWNFFFVNGIFYNMAYILFSWKLGFWEIGTKLFVWQEVYETLLYILAPFILPMSFIINPVFTGIMIGATTAIYLVNAIVFNEIHLRIKKERVSWICIAYYMWYKFVLTFVNILSCYWSIFKYAQYFAVRHPKITEDEKALGVVLNLESVQQANTPVEQTHASTTTTAGQPKRGMSIRTHFATRSNEIREDQENGRSNRRSGLLDRIASVHRGEMAENRGEIADLMQYRPYRPSVPHRDNNV